MDIYLIDQIMKGRYQSGQQILDAGSGSGRNLHWFLVNGFDITSCDKDEMSDGNARLRFPDFSWKHHTADLAYLPFADESFDHVVCNAVLHFAENEAHFRNMWEELMRVCRMGGSVFVRTCTNIGIEDKIEPLSNGRHRLLDESERFLLTQPLLDSLLTSSEGIQLLEPIKWLNVSGLRVMMTLVVVKRM